MKGGKYFQSNANSQTNDEHRGPWRQKLSNGRDDVERMEEK